MTPKDQTIELLLQLQQKLVGSAVLNGGFDTLLIKINSLEENQNIISQKIDMIHEAIYDPDDGLFARIKDVDVEQFKDKALSLDRLDKDILKLQQLHEVDGTLLKREEELSHSSDENSQQLRCHADQLKELVKFKDNINAVAKWSFITLAGGAATLVGKLIYTFVNGHVIVR